MTFKLPIQLTARQLLNNNLKGEDGFYPVGVNNFWHGGIHLRKFKSIHAIADGEVIAYRLTNQYLTDPATEEEFSNSFVLIRHAFVTPKGEDICFYSLYMHLLPLQEYEKQKIDPDKIPPFFNKQAGNSKEERVKPSDQIIVLQKPFQVQAGDLIGYPSRIDFAPMFHLEVFMENIDFMDNFMKDKLESPEGENYFDWRRFFDIREEPPGFAADGICGLKKLIELIETVPGNPIPDGLLAPEEIQNAVTDRIVAEKLKKMVTRHPTEWSSSLDKKMKKYDRLKEKPWELSDKELNEEILPHIQTMQWWDKVFPKGERNSPDPENLWFIHPIALIEHLRKLGKEEAVVNVESLDLPFAEEYVIKTEFLVLGWEMFKSIGDFLIDPEEDNFDILGVTEELVEKSWDALSSSSFHSALSSGIKKIIAAKQLVLWGDNTKTWGGLPPEEAEEPLKEELIQFGTDAFLKQLLEEMKKNEKFQTMEKKIKDVSDEFLRTDLKIWLDEQENQMLVAIPILIIGNAVIISESETIQKSLERDKSVENVLKHFLKNSMLTIERLQKHKIKLGEFEQELKLFKIEGNEFGRVKIGKLDYTGKIIEFLPSEEKVRIAIEQQEFEVKGVKIKNSLKTGIMKPDEITLESNLTFGPKTTVQVGINYNPESHALKSNVGVSHAISTKDTVETKTSWSKNHNKQTLGTTHVLSDKNSLNTNVSWEKNNNTQTIDRNFTLVYTTKSTAHGVDIQGILKIDKEGEVKVGLGFQVQLGKE